MKNKIKQILEKAGDKPYTAAKKMEISVNTVYSWVNNPSKIPSGDGLDALYKVYGAKPNDCLENEEGIE